MKLASPQLLLDLHAQLGEGPAWDAAAQRLYWLDILAGHLHCFDPLSAQDELIPFEQSLGCVAPTRSGALLLALKQGLALFDPRTHALRYLCSPEAHLPGNRFNDGKCGPDGRFLIGSMDNAEQLASGSLYSLQPGGQITSLLSGLRISNGLAWSPDYKTFYFIDTPTRQVMAYDYQLQTGAISNPRIAIQIPPALGWPDGMTSDTDGRLWVALWGGAALSVWEPATGRLLQKIDLPAKNITSCVFGGPNLNQLYITSACKGLDAAERSAYPASGGLFRIETDVTGLPTFAFAD